MITTLANASSAQLRCLELALRFLPLLGVASLGLGAGLLYAIGPG